MEALIYEHLIRMIYQTGRTTKNGADADIYRKLERAERAYHDDLENIRQNQLRSSSKSIEDLEFDYSVERRRIWQFVVTAIQEGIKRYGYKFSADEISSMENSINTFVDIQRADIDRTIKLVMDIYSKKGIVAP
ncbi:MAG: hypothetical protein JNM21_14860 [Taibaiella sp.]|nr:hypothetical protein [Taibaiella sp.]